MLPAARILDKHACPQSSGPIIQGASSVFITGRPAARIGDQVTCAKPEFISGGEKTVLIEGKAAARITDTTLIPNACPGKSGGVIIEGCNSVLIGSSYPEQVLREASKRGSAFCDRFEVGQTDEAKRSRDILIQEKDKINYNQKKIDTDSYVNVTPVPPKPPKPDEGSGPHGTEENTIIDNISETKWYTVANLAESIGYADAARHMRHYLDGSGKDLKVKPESMLRDMPQFKQQAKSDLNSFIQDIQMFMKDKYNGHETSENFTSKFAGSNWKNFYATKRKSSNWYYAMGGFSYSYTAKATANPSNDGTAQLDIRYQMHVYDRYNWDKGKKVHLGDIFQVNDSTLGRLHQVGLAKEYDIKGSTEPKTIQMKLNQINTTDTQSSTNDRNADLEDREQKRDRTGKRSDFRRERH